MGTEQTGLSSMQRVPIAGRQALVTRAHHGMVRVRVGCLAIVVSPDLARDMARAVIVAADEAEAQQ